MKRGLQAIPILFLTLCFFMRALLFPKIRAQPVQHVRTLPAFIDVRSCGITSCSSRELSSRPASTKYTTVFSSHRILPLVRPPDPASYNNDNNRDNDGKQSYVQNQAQILREWMRGKKQIVCITGAGMSTESNIPDYVSMSMLWKVCRIVVMPHWAYQLSFIFDFHKLITCRGVVMAVILGGINQSSITNS